MKQLFQVGEKVITIDDPSDPYWIAGHIGNIISIKPRNGNYYYRVDGITTEKNMFHAHQRYFRKHHPPSTQSFTEIMEELKGPVKA